MAQAARQQNRVDDGDSVEIRDRQFGFAEARHLLWRAGFGGTPEQIRVLAEWGPEKAVDYLLDTENIAVEPVKANDFDRNIMRPLTEAEEQAQNRARRSRDENTLARFRARRQQAQASDRNQMAELQRWWLTRMIETPRPLEEKLTLFWHGHFATSYRTIENSYHLFLQNQFFRANALGSFASLLGGIIRDPAMIAYLDNNDSSKYSPNENLARELMELFGLGVGNYTERDIKEGARALTGYTFRDDEFYFNEENHDTGTKSILGSRGNFDGDDFAGIILSQRACSEYITDKLYAFFAGTPEEVDFDGRGSKATRKRMGAAFRDGYSIRKTLKRLFMSTHFYSPAVMNAKIKSPVVLTVGAIRSLGVPHRDLRTLLDAMERMGQDIFYPPSVKGWDGGRAWINTSTLFVRQNIINYLLTGMRPQGMDAHADDQPYDPTPLLAPLADADVDRDPDAVVDYLLRFAVGHASESAAEPMRAFLHRHGDRITPETVTGLLLLVAAMPEYQLC